MKLRQAALHAGTDLESILSTDRDIAATALSRGQPHHVLLATSLHCVLAMLVKESRSRHSVVLETVKRYGSGGVDGGSTSASAGAAMLTTCVVHAQGPRFGSVHQL